MPGEGLQRLDRGAGVRQRRYVPVPQRMQIDNLPGFIRERNLASLQIELEHHAGSLECRGCEKGLALLGGKPWPKRRDKASGRGCSAFS